MRLVTLIEARARELDPRAVIGGVETLESILTRAQSPWRFTAWMFTVFGALAFTLASGGLASVVALSVSERRRELALRAALGARPEDAVRLVLGQSLRLAAPGVLTGAAAAAFAGRWLRSLLFDVGALDPGTFLAVPVLVVAILLLVTWLPALRASRIAPGLILRD